MKCPVCNKFVENFMNDNYFCYKCNTLYSLISYELKEIKICEDYYEAEEIVKTIGGETENGKEN